MAFEDRKTWLLVGSALSAERFFDPALRLAIDHGWRTATSNGGWQLFTTTPFKGEALGWIVPDWFWLSDHEACAMPAHRRALRLMRSLGTKLVTAELRDPALYQVRGLGEPDAISPAPTPGSDRRHPYVPGEWCRPKYSGLMLLQWVLNTQSPARVILVGYDGYGSKPDQIVRETIDGRLGKTSGWNDTLSIIAPFVQSCVDALAGTEFVICGRPAWCFDPTVARENLTILHDPTELEALA
ncbi:MAG: hypothetical protein IT445_03115 [Phycisphaeraceae bacterium]|nr:hypothetical protein [Phycisphaeraceae bacterium]